MTIEELEIVIEAQTREFNQQIANVTNQVSRMEKQVNKSLGNIKNILGRVGKWIAALGIGKAIATAKASRDASQALAGDPWSEWQAPEPAL